jgi:outer membrane protein
VLIVKKLQWWTILAACVVALPVSSSHAQQRPMAGMGIPQGIPSNIAVLDVSYVFKNLPRFKAFMEQMQADVAAAENDVKKEREALKHEIDQLEQFRSGTPDYKEREAQLTRRRAELATRIELQKRDFLQRESKIYNTIYEEMMQEVEYYAANNGVAMVLRFNGDPVDTQKPEDVLRRINQPIIWYPRDRDITPIILEKLANRGGGANPAASTQPLIASRRIGRSDHRWPDRPMGLFSGSRANGSLGCITDAISKHLAAWLPLRELDTGATRMFEWSFGRPLLAPDWSSCATTFPARHVSQPLSLTAPRLSAAPISVPPASLSR